MQHQVVLEFPAGLPEEGLQDKNALRKGKEIIVLEFLRKEEISQGKAVELLEIDRYTLFDLMAKYDIPIASFSPEELQLQREDAERRKEGKK